MNQPMAEDIGQAISNEMALLHAGKMELAREQALEILSHYPNEPNSLFTIAVVTRHELGNAAGLALLLELIEREPKFALAHQELGYAYAALGNFYPAIAALQAAVEIAPNLAGAWKVMGELFLAEGDERSASAAFNRHIKEGSDNLDLVQALVSYGKGQIGQAEQLCRQVLKEDPLEINAIRLLADIGVRVGVYEDAENLLARCLELQPDYHLARLNYANVLSKREKLELALAEINTLLGVEPNKPSLLVLRASILAKMGLFYESLEDYEYLISNCSPRAKIFLSYAHALKAIGRREDAIEAYRQAIEVEPEFGDAYWSLANLKTFEFNQLDIDAMHTALTQPSCDEEDQFHLYFALGKAYEHRQEYSRSFQYYQLGNDRKKTLDQYDAVANREMVNRVISTCDQSLFTARQGLGCDAPDPIFIVGLPRSGSTLLEQILASHSLVDGTKELVHMLAIVQRLGEKKRKADVSRYPEVLWDLTPEQLKQLGNEYLQRTAVQRSQAPIFIDKMPNNYLHVGLIKLILPNARIIDARRHPMATCFSAYTQLFAKGQSFTYGLKDLADYYADYYRLMDHWDSVLPGQVLCVHYEDVVRNTESKVREILQFCGLPFEESCLRFYETQRAVRTASSEQVRRPIYDKGLTHWHNYSGHLSVLEDQLADLSSQYPNYE